MEAEEKRTLEESISNEKRKLRGYDEMQIEVDELAKSLRACIEIVGSSISEPSLTSKLNDYMAENEKLRRRATTKIYGDIKATNNAIYEMSSKMTEEDESEEKEV